MSESLGFWKWLAKNIKKALTDRSINRMIIVYLASAIPMLIVVKLFKFPMGLMALLIWLIFWSLYCSYNYYKEVVVKRRVQNGEV